MTSVAVAACTVMVSRLVWMAVFPRVPNDD